MSSNIVLKRGLDIPVKGAADRRVMRKVEPGLVAVNPTVYKGLVPRLLVREGDPVSAGSPVLADKDRPEILFTSPVSGSVKEIVRGEKRRLLAVVIESDGKGAAVDFGACDPASLSREDATALLLKSGLWGGIISRPYGVMADPSVSPKAIFSISHFGELCAAADVQLSGQQLDDFYAAILPLMQKNLDRMQEDVNWLIEKFDYRNADADWKNSKDAIQRGMQKIKGGYPADPPLKMKK